jgi:hypothetical protein
MDQKGAALSHCDGRIEENTAAIVVDLRRRIAAAWRRYSAREQRGKAEGVVGYL